MVGFKHRQIPPIYTVYSMALNLKTEGIDSSAPLSNASGSLKTKNNWT